MSTVNTENQTTQTETQEERLEKLRASFKEEKFAYLSMTASQRFFGHLKTVLRHKSYVFEGCCRIGLYWQGFWHDLSKFSPTEFKIGITYFDGHKSPNAVERRVNDGCSTSWLHHKGRNKHHFEYWMDYTSRPQEGVIGTKMPLRYVAEMVCDRRAACMAYNPQTYTQAAAWDHYMLSNGYLIMHRDTRAVLEEALYIMKEDGEEACFAFLRKILKVTKGQDYTAESLGLTEDRCGNRAREAARNQ